MICFYLVSFSVKDLDGEELENICEKLFYNENLAKLGYEHAQFEREQKLKGELCRSISIMGLKSSQFRHYARGDASEVSKQKKGLRLPQYLHLVYMFHSFHSYR